MYRTDSIPSGTDFPMLSRSLALLEAANYQMFFDVRKFRAHPNSPITGTVRVTSDGVIVHEEQFDGNNLNWGTVCIDNFTTISSNNMVSFGIEAPPPDNGIPSAAIYLVDDIQIDQI